MYPALLITHSILRWLVLFSLLFAIFCAWRGWLGGKKFTKADDFIRHATASAAHVQMLIGLILYFISPVVGHFLGDFSNAVSVRELRFFGMEHSIMMLAAVSFISIGSSAAKRKATGKAKFKTMAIWFSLALLIIFFNIPWSFLPVTPDRPYFRWFF